MDAVTVKKAVFAESCAPPLKSGEYIMTASLCSKTLGDSFPVKQELWVEGERFAIQEEDICCVYPPAGSRGSFGNSLPHIVFYRKTLPWERSADAQKNGLSATPSFHTPWLALLQLREGEAKTVSADTVKNALHPASSDIYVPHLHLRKEEENDMCSYIDLETTLFREVFPAYEDLPYLCHARKTEPYAKSDDLCGPENEWCSVIMGARMPDVSGEGRKNSVYLVSLEGYDNYSMNDKIDGFSCIRLFVLHSWTYEAVSVPWHFKEICKNLNAGSLTLPAQDGQEAALSFLEHGYVPMRHQIRNGDSAVSFYRGPLTPTAVKHREIPSVSSSDSLYVYDPEIGMFDVSYACAWQIGRLAALNQKSIALKLLQARTENRKKIHTAMLKLKMDSYCNLRSEDGEGYGLANDVLAILEKHLRREE